MDVNMINLGSFIVSELQKMMIPGKQLFISGNMQLSTNILEVNENYVDIIIATPYASFTNSRGKMAGWVEKTIDRACRCFASNNNIDNDLLSGTIFYGG